MHHDEPDLSRRSRGNAKRPAGQIERYSLHMLRAVWGLPLPEGDGDVVEEMALAADRSKRQPDDADEVKAEYRKVLISAARRTRPLSLAPIV